jgi:hypothetical protein
MVVDDRSDRLVLASGAGPGEWWTRVIQVVRGTWRVLVPLAVLTLALPLALFHLAVPVDAPWFGPGAVLLLGLITAFGWSACAFAMTRWAAALPHGVGISLRYAWWRFNRVWLWTTVALLAVAFGLFFLVVPGLLIAFALCMTLPAASFERAGPLGRSWTLVRREKAAVLVRVGPLVAGFVAVGALLAVVAPAFVAVVAAGAPLLFAGLLVTYAQLRGGELAVRAVTLAAELESPRLIVASPPRS